MATSNNNSSEQRLVQNVLDVSYQANPTYTHNEHLAWALGILAQTVLRKNYMDSIVFSELHYKLNTILDTNKFPTSFTR